MDYRIEALTKEEAGYIGEKINEIVPHEVDADKEEFVLKVENEKGEIIGGCIVEVDSWKIAELDILWVDEKYRRQGLGSALIREAERAAREKGCYAMTLGTFDFQARPLYEKHGYTVCGILEDCPKGHRWCQMQKLL